MTPNDRGGASADAVRHAFEAHYSRLVAGARLLLDTTDDAEEAVQEAFCRTLATWTAAGRTDDPLPYLRTAVANLGRTGLRRRRTVRLAPVPRATPVDEASDRILGTERQAALVRSLRALPPQQRACVVFRYLLDCSTAETAATLGVSEGTVKTHLHRALQALGPHLEALR